MKRNYEKTRCETCPTRHKSMFNSLGQEGVEVLDQSKHCQLYKKGEIIFHENGIPHGVYCVQYGKIKLFKTGMDGRDQIIRFAQNGDLLGYRSLLSGESFNASASCLEDSQLCFIPREELMKLLSENNSLAIGLMKSACHELGEAARIITNLAQKSNRERVAEVLLILKSNFELDETNAIDVQLTREEIANMVGTATESVIRILSDFNKEGVIKLEGKRIILEDIPALVKIAKVEDY